MVRIVQVIQGFILSSALLTAAALADPSAIDSSAGLMTENEARELDDVSDASSENGGETDDGSSAESSSTSFQTGGGSGSAASSGPLSKLTIHGFLTQAWATADFVNGRVLLPDGSDPGPTFDEIALGIPEDGTFDYRTLALQFRYEITPKDIMVIQFSSRSLGDSPINDVEDEIELDWAFYERRLRDNTSLKIGRVQIPLGIFNEIRDVGTILPFYRPPFIFYREGTFTSETVDGLALSHTFRPESDWSLDADFYVGEWDSFEQSFFDEALSIANNEGYGFQLWLNTPVSGLRLGFGGHTRDVTGGSEGAIREIGATSTFDDWYASVDGVFDRFVVRAEYREFDGKAQITPVFLNGLFRGKIILYYGQLGFHPTDKFRVYVQAEFNPTESQVSTFTQDLDADVREDFGIAFNYLFSPNLVLKAEYHDVQGEDIGLFPVFTPGGLLLQPFTQDLDDGSYAIVSFSASF